MTKMGDEISDGFGRGKMFSAVFSVKERDFFGGGEQDSRKKCGPEKNDREERMKVKGLKKNRLKKG